MCVLIDEVESLTAARQAALNGNEPSDALRVVNAVLTQLDQLRGRSNVLLLTTSNLPDACDAAFVDRAVLTQLRIFQLMCEGLTLYSCRQDIKQFIGQPPVSARYAILASCVQVNHTSHLIFRSAFDFDMYTDNRSWCVWAWWRWPADASSSSTFAPLSCCRALRMR